MWHVLVDLLLLPQLLHLGLDLQPVISFFKFFHSDLPIKINALNCCQFRAKSTPRYHLNSRAGTARALLGAITGPSRWSLLQFLPWLPGDLGGPPAKAHTQRFLSGAGKTAYYSRSVPFSYDFPNRTEKCYHISNCLSRAERSPAAAGGGGAQTVERAKPMQEGRGRFHGKSLRRGPAPDGQEHTPGTFNCFKKRGFSSDRPGD